VSLYLRNNSALLSAGSDFGGLCYTAAAATGLKATSRKRDDYTEFHQTAPGELGGGEESLYIPS